MKKSIILVLIYFAMQFAAMALAYGVGMVYFYASGEDNVDYRIMAELMITPTLVLGFIFMGIYLWRAGYLKPAKELWNMLTPAHWGWTALLGAALIFILDTLMGLLDFLPDMMEDTFEAIENGWVGILGIAVLGPILEEMLFRGAITRELQKHYSEIVTIILSGLIFGLFHINPAQVIPAMFIGFLLAWLYVKTKSLIPGIIVHIMNNSLSCYFSAAYPEATNVTDILNFPVILLGLVLSLGLGYLAFKKLQELFDAEPAETLEVAVADDEKPSESLEAPTSDGKIDL